MSAYGHRFEDWLQESGRFLTDWHQRNQLNYEYYDNRQWTEAEKSKLDDRGQQASVLNIIRPTVDMIISMENERTTNLQIQGRTPDDEATASLFTELISQVYTQNNLNYHISRVFRSGIVGGMGWLEAGVRDDEAGRPEIAVHLREWNTVFFDPFMKEPDATDARYIIYRHWMDRDEVGARFDVTDAELNSIEGWQPGSGKDGTVDEFDGREDNAQENADSFTFNKHYDSKSRRVAINETWYKNAEGKLHYVIWAGNVFLQGGLEDSQNTSPLDFDHYPIVPYIASMRHDGTPQGIVDWVKDEQDAINKLFSKWMWVTMSRQVAYEADAVEDPEELRAQIARPDGVIKLEPGALARNAFQMLSDKTESSHLLQMMQFQIQMAQRVSGVNDATLGLGGVNARSAEQENSRATSGAQMQSSFLENLFFTKTQLAKIIMRLIGQYYTKEIAVRSVAPTGDVVFTEFNKGNVDADGQPFIENEITMANILRYDVVVEHVMAFSTVKQLQARWLNELAQTGALPPQIVGELALQFSDIPNKDDVMQRLTAFNQQQAELQQQQMQMQQQQQLGQ